MWLPLASFAPQRTRRFLSLPLILVVVILLAATVALLSTAIHISDAAPVIGVMTRPVANLRASKTRHVPLYGQYDPDQNTQLQFGECVEQTTEDESDGWYGVKTVNSQYRYKDDSGWDGYDGFIEAGDVTWFPKSKTTCPRRDIVVSAPWTPLYNRECSIENGCLEGQVLLHVTVGTLLELCDNTRPWGELGWACVNVWIDGQQQQAQVLAADVTAVNTNFLGRDTLPNDTVENRDAVLKQTTRLLGYPYFWGGYSARSLTCGCQSADALTGLDCSGLTGLAMRSAGLYMGVPRDAHDMFLMTNNVTHPRHMQRGDYFFFANDKGRMTHIMVYVGENMLAEATATVNATRIVSLSDRFQNGVVIPEDIFWGMESEFGKIYFGTPFVKRDNTMIWIVALAIIGSVVMSPVLFFTIPVIVLVMVALRRHFPSKRMQAVSIQGYGKL